MLVAPELAEAAARTGDAAQLQEVLDRVGERARVTPTDWLLGIEARVRALAGAGDVEGHHRASLEHLGRTRAARWSSPALGCSMANGCAARGGGWTRASSCGPPTAS